MDSRSYLAPPNTKTVFAASLEEADKIVTRYQSANPAASIRSFVVPPGSVNGGRVLIHIKIQMGQEVRTS